MRATCRKSKLYHSDAVAQRITESIDRKVGGVVVAEGAGDEDREGTGARPSDAHVIVVRVFHDHVTVSVDSSGALLHLRGYRQAVARAPLRETLAAAMLLGADWDPVTPLVDPMCGSGTIAIEGALLARHIPPGLSRTFAFERWPGFERDLWDELRDRARERILPAAPAPILASDRDAGAVRAAAANAERAGVALDVRIERRSLSGAAPPESEHGTGALVVNPPYGLRVGGGTDLRNLYARLGQVARSRFPGWRMAVLSADEALERQLRLPLSERFRASNGGIPVRLVVGVIAG